MLKRLKKSLSLTLVLALCMSFIACGSDGKSDDNFSDDSDSFEGRVKGFRADRSTGQSK